MTRRGVTQEKSEDQGVLNTRKFDCTYIKPIGPTRVDHRDKAGWPRGCTLTHNRSYPHEQKGQVLAKHCQFSGWQPTLSSFSTQGRSLSNDSNRWLLWKGIRSLQGFSNCLCQDYSSTWPAPIVGRCHRRVRLSRALTVRNGLGIQYGGYLDARFLPSSIK